MPYNSKEKQREYQRKWQKNKSINKNNTFKLNGNYIEWKDLEKYKYIEKINTWNECIDIASNLISLKKTDRIAAATLAIAGCRIRHGGDFRSADFLNGKYGISIKKFAKDININHKTLYEWIKVKHLIVDKIIDKSKPLDYSAARIAMTKSIHDPSIGLSIYNEISGNESYRNSLRAPMYINNCLSVLSTYGIKYLNDEEKKYIIEKAQSILNIFGLN